MDTSTPRGPATPDPKQLDGEPPDVPPDEAADVLFPDTLAPRAYQRTRAAADDDEDARRG